MWSQAHVDRIRHHTHSSLTWNILWMNIFDYCDGYVHCIQIKPISSLQTMISTISFVPVEIQYSENSLNTVFPFISLYQFENRKYKNHIIQFAKCQQISENFWLLFAFTDKAFCHSDTMGQSKFLVTLTWSYGCSSSVWF